MKQKIFWILLSLIFMGSFLKLSAQTFTNPGIPLSASDLATLKAHIQAGDYPWKQAYDNLAADGHSQLSYTMRGPFASVSRNPNVNLNEWRSDMTAIFNLSLMWYFTGNGDYATKARDILLAWATTQTEFVGIESNLDLGDYAFAWGGGASILRGTWSGWTQGNTEAVKSLFDNVYWPATGCDGFALGPANKGTLSMEAGAAIAAFSDDPDKIAHIVYLMRTCASAGFSNTLPSGEIGESARDQGHAHGDWSGMALAAEILWKQGIDMFSELNNRILAEGEYFARKNEGGGIPYITYGTTDALYLTDETVLWDGGDFGLTLAQSAYGTRMGLQTPYISRRLNHLGRQTDMKTAMFLKSVDNSTATVPTKNFSVPYAPLAGSGNFTGLDIGGAHPAGSASYVNNIWTVKGAGQEVWTHGNDGCHFEYKAVEGNCTIIAKVDSVQATAGTSKAGIMIRSDLTDHSAQRAWIAITPAQTSESYMHGWTEVRGGSNWEKGSRDIPSKSYWVKIERIGDVIALYYSPDGVSWAVHKEGRFEGFTGTAYIGLFVCSLNDGVLNTSKFSNVCVTGGSNGTVTVPIAPYAIYASPGNGEVPLRWLSSFGASSYTIKRSTAANGNYSVLASGLTSNDYTDHGVQNGQRYYYKVSAVNSAGTSPDSPSDSTTPLSAHVIMKLEGTYRIIPLNSGKSIEVKDSSIADGANVDQWTTMDRPHQLWEVSLINGDNYKIMNVGSGKALDVVGNSTVKGSKIEQRAYASGDSSQVWTVLDNGNGLFRVLNKASGQSLDVVSSSALDGALMEIWPFSGGPNQTFRFERVDKSVLTGTYMISAKSSGKFVSVKDSSHLDGAVIEQMGNDSGKYQMWTLDHLTGNDYTVMNLGSGKVLGLKNRLTADATKLEQQTLVLGDASQIWTITKNGDTTYHIQNKLSGSSLDVSSNSLADGALLELWPYKGSDNQRFYLDSIYQSSIQKLSQEINFPSLLMHEPGFSDFDPMVVTTSGLPVELTSSDTTVAKIVNGHIQYAGQGKTIITASQKGNLLWEPAAPVSHELEVNQSVLPASNFAISVKGPSCAGENNGELDIRASQVRSYNATISGSSDKVFSFTDVLAVQSLAPGRYSVCLTTTDLPSYKQCFDFVVPDAAPITVASSVNLDRQEVDLRLSGGSTFTVNLNGKLYHIQGDKATLGIKAGMNKLMISTDKPCQVPVAKNIVVEGRMSVYPNPFTRQLYVHVPIHTDALWQINVYRLNGLKVLSRECTSSDGVISLDLPVLAQGNYLLEAESADKRFTTKILKK